MVDLKQIADDAEVIIDGYAFSRYHDGYRVLNLNAPDKAAVFAADTWSCKQQWTTSNCILLPSI